MQTYLLVGGDAFSTFELRHGLNSIGRNPSNDFRVSDSSVSSFHCEVVVGEEGVVVRDLQSTNGTFVNGQQIQESPLRPGEQLRLGNVDFKLDAPPVHVAIPTIKTEETPQATVLPDGAPACVNHVGVHALFRCQKCGQTYCDSCVRRVGLAGSKSMVFCATCDGACVEIKITPAKQKKESIFGRLTQTIRIFRK
ncbi:MAG TPA: FHA domain-containing protein [Verrucomicrobiae bacterium]|nr:FHA domain-containing protein [Verrucomicrobiae bacterium]